MKGVCMLCPMIDDELDATDQTEIPVGVDFLYELGHVERSGVDLRLSRTVLLFYLFAVKVILA